MVDAFPACSVKYYIQGSTLGAVKLVVCTVFIFNSRVLCIMYIKFIFILYTRTLITLIFTEFYMSNVEH